jgi:hypothetical protein
LRASLISNSSEMTVQDTQTKVPTSQTKIPVNPTGTAIGSTSLPAGTGNTGLEQILKRPTSAINELGRFLRQNRSDASSPGPTSPSRIEEVLPSSTPGSSGRDASPPPYTNMPGASLSANTEPSRSLVRSPQPSSHVTPLRNICMLHDSTSGILSHVPFAPSQ